MNLKNKIINIVIIMTLVVSWVLISENILNRYLNIILMLFNIWSIFQIKTKGEDYADKKGVQIGVLIIYVILIVLI